ncbi:MAG: hypothetical protein LBD37_10285 [Treponema sp.]|jgi:hypothetical protein|nr:hypothetical protein [Treponema sp.]
MRYNAVIVAAFAGLCLGGCPAAPGGDRELYLVQYITVQSGKHAALLSWEPLASPKVRAYHIYAGNRKTGPYTLLARRGGGAAYEHRGLVKGQRLWYKIAAADSQGRELGALAAARPVQGAAFGAPPGPVRVTSNYQYQNKEYIKLSWDADAAAQYYAVAIYREPDNGEGETLAPLGSLTVRGRRFFQERTILWEAGPGAYRFVLFHIYALQRDAAWEDGGYVLAEDVSMPGALSAIGYIPEKR